MADIIEIPSGEENTTESICRLISGDGHHQVDVQADRSDLLSYQSSSRYVQTIVSASLADFFVSFLPTEDARLKAVFWQFEGAVLRICTIIESDDFEFERAIYGAERKFLEKFPDVPSDFYVIFQQGRGLEEIRPADSNLAFSQPQ